MAESKRSSKADPAAERIAKDIIAPDVENLADEADLAKKVQDEANVYFERFASDREEIDDKNEQADYMYACAQSRSMMSSEKSKGMDRDGDTRANVGSIIFHRQVNTMAAQFAGVLRSRPDLAKYEQMWVDGVEGSYEDSLDRAKQAMGLARWTRKKDEFDRKIPEIAVSLCKYSNIFAMIEQKRTFKRKLCTEPVTEEVVDPATGETTLNIIGERKYWDNVVVDNYPSITFPHVGNIYADRWIPTIQQQNCVVICSPVNRTDIFNDVQMGFYSKEAYDKLDNGYFWDGVYGATMKEKEHDNREETFSPSGTDVFLKWEVFIRVPIEGKEWDDDNPPQLYWMTVIGNTLGGGLVMRLERNPDPDDEIPLKEIRIMPDNSDTLYHTTTAEIVRSMYSADCSLLNMFLDNIGNRNDPPLQILDGMHRVKDFTLTKGALWYVYQKDAISTVDIPDTTQNTVMVRDRIHDEIKQALATDPAMMGQYAGARTPATEFLGVNQNTNKLHFMWISYAANQILPWQHRKYMSYWNAFGLPQQVVQITDGDKKYNIRPKDVAGEYDIIVDIVDEYVDDLVRQQTLTQVMQLIGTVPGFQQSETHTLDMGELLKAWFEHNRYPASRLVLPATGRDAEEVANARISVMLNSGVYNPPVAGENLGVHLRTAKAERVRWKGLEDSPDPRAANLPLLDQYIAECTQMMQGAGGVGGAGQQQVGMGPQNETPGEVIGNQAAAALGKQMGGIG